MRRAAPALAVLLAASAGAAAPADEAFLKANRERLKALVRLDTSDPPGREDLAAAYLKAQLDQAGIPAEIVASTPTRASLIARLKGDGGQRPLLLLCHTDVVPADRADWSVDPFAGVEKDDGYLYGRGAADDKSLCASELSILVWLKEKGARLSRDVIYVAAAGEESGERDRPMAALLNERPELAAELAINEGGGIRWGERSPTRVHVQTAEKRYLDLRVSARGGAGHAAVPRSDNAVAAVARAVVRLADGASPARLEPIVKEMLAEEENISEEPLRTAVRQVLEATPGRELDRAADRLMVLAPQLGALLRDTVVPTELRAGYKSNVIPSRAEAILNARLLPSTDPKSFIASLRELIDDPSIEVEWGDQPSPARASPAEGPFYRAIETVARDLVPGARVGPFLSPGSTDSEFLRARGTIVYGLDPPLTAADAERVHGGDERISLAALDWYAVFLRAVVLKTAASEGRAVAPSSQ